MSKIKRKHTLRRVMLAAFLLILAYAFFIVFYKLQPSVQVYFFKDNSLAAVGRALHKGDNKIEVAIAELIKGPSPKEQAMGYFTQIPKLAKVKSLKIAEGTAIIDFSRDLANYGGGISRVKGMLAQIVFTLTELPNINKVMILVEGNKQPALGGEGYVIDKPLARDNLGN